MANNKIQMSQEDFEMDLVQRRLTGVATTISVDIPWHIFEEQIQYVVENLEREGVIITPSQVMQNMKIFEAFLDSVDVWEKDHIDYYLDEIAMDTHAIAQRFFRTEIDTQRKIKAEEEKQKREEAARRKAELDANGVSIKVDKKNHKKAEAILRAAGLLKTDD